VSGVNGFEDIKGYENLNVSHVTQATSLLGVNFSFLLNADLANNCTKFEARIFSHCEDTARKPKNVHLEKM